MTEALSVIARHTRPPRAAEVLRPQDLLTDVGLDSLRFLMVVLELRELPSGRGVTAEAVAGMRTVGDVLDAFAPSSNSDYQHGASQ